MLLASSTNIRMYEFIVMQSEETQKTRSSITAEQAKICIVQKHFQATRKNKVEQQIIFGAVQVPSFCFSFRNVTRKRKQFL